MAVILVWGTIYSATDGPGGLFLWGDHPRRDNPSNEENGSSIRTMLHVCEKGLCFILTPIYDSDLV